METKELWKWWEDEGKGKEEVVKKKKKRRRMTQKPTRFKVLKEIRMRK